MIDIAIFTVFLSLNLIVGLRYRGRSQSFREYAIGNKKFSTAVLTATIVATWMSGSAFFIDLENTYSKGLFFIIAVLIGFTGGGFLTGRVIGPRMGKFLNNVSVAEALGTLYGKHIQVITGASAVLKSIGYIAIQFQVISRILTILFNYKSPWVTVIAATIIILYSTSGGVKAVTFTDVIQFVTFGTLLPVLALVIWYHLQDPRQVAEVLRDNPLFNFKEVIGWTPEFMATIALICYFITPVLPPMLYQRIAMARDVQQVKRSITYATFICLAVNICMIWIAILILADQPGLAPNQVVAYMVNTYTYPGLKGLLGIGIIALAMSTADSTLNSCAVIIANDILPPLQSKQSSSLKVARWATGVLGGVALIIALKELNLLKLLLLSASFYSPIVVIPMLMAIFGFQTSKRVVSMAMAAGFTTVVTCLVCFKSVNGFFPGMIANCIVLLGAHYLLGEKGGWGHNPVEDNTNSLFKRSTWQAWIATVKRFKLYTYLERVLPQQEYAYLLLGLYIFTTTYASFYLLPQAVYLQYPKLYQGIQYSVTLFTTSFLAFPIWPRVLQSKHCFIWIWPITIFYTLFLVGGLLAIMGGFTLPQMFLLALNFAMALLLLHWPLVLTTAISGVLVAILFFKQYTGLESLPGDVGSLQLKIIYGLLLLSSFLIALFRHKQAYAHLVARHQLLKEASKEVDGRLLEALRCREELLKELKPDEAELFDGTTAGFINHVIYRVRNYLRLEVGQANLSQLLQEVMATLELQDPQPLPKIHQKTQHQTLQADIARLKQLLVNSVCYIKGYEKTHKPLIVGLEDATLGYEVSYMKNYIKKISALKITITTDNQLPPIQELYKVIPDQPTIYLPEREEDLRLEENARIADAHYGYIETIQTETSYTQIYVIPIAVREVRSKVMELLRTPVAVVPEELKHPLAIQLEKELFDKLQGTGVDLKMLRKALQTIKRYHSGVRRKSGEPFFTHPMAVALILLEYTQDQAAVLAALLHDTVEDTSLTLVQLEAMFGSTVSFLVGKVTNLEGKVRRLNLADHENIQRLTHYEDVRVAFVKLSDRLHNMRTIGSMPPVKQQRIAQETISFFVPMAKNLELEAMTKELESLSLAILSNK